MVEQKRKPIGILLTVILISALLTVCLELGLSYLRPDTPGSIPKHLIHFAIMFVLFGGATLLCLFCPPFKKLWAWLDKYIMSQETRPIAIDIIYAVIAGLMLLHHFYVLLYYPTIPAGATRFAPVWIIFAALTVILGKSWKNVSFRLAAIFLIYSFERLFLEKKAVTSENIVFFVSAIYALFICLGLFSALHPKIKKPFLRSLCAFWSLCTLILCILSIYTTWTGINIRNIEHMPIFIYNGRLYVFSDPTISASNLGCGVIMALIGFSISKNRFIRSLYLLIAFVTIMTNALTDSRSSVFVLALIISGMVTIKFWLIYHKQTVLKKPSNKKNALAIIALVFCFGLCFYGTVEGQRYLGIQFIEIRNNRGLISTAQAEITSEIATESTDNQQPAITPVPLQLEQRDIWLSEDNNITDTFNGRIDFWCLALKYVQEHPQILLSGVSVDGTAASIVGREDHSHNIYIQSLLEGGIPALVLFLLLVVYGIYHSFRIWRQPNVPYWQLILPLPMFAVLLWEMAECLSHFSYGHPPMTLLWFFMGCTIAVSKSLGKTEKPPKIPADSTESIYRE